MKDILGTVTMVLAVAMVVIALPKQIRKIAREKKCGLDLSMILLPLGVYMARFCYAVAMESWYILVPDLLGVGFSVKLLLQYHQFKGK
ncbi:MAG: hypothetical protein HGB37_02890 [Candidatus Moranbacteria bacterium]|nr:hypothetical protein [Candidatus Moranbacteria bacterium]NTW89826.1 hypothetical protein [Candidatus Moranbacteria bacterium]